MPSKNFDCIPRVVRESLRENQNVEEKEGGESRTISRFPVSEKNLKT